MAANAYAAFTRQANISSVLVTAANTSSQGGGTIATDIFKAWTADATNGSWLDNIVVAPTASVANTATAATVARIFISTVTSGATTSSNTYLVYTLQLPSITADSSSNAENIYRIPLGWWVPASNTVLVTNHAAPNANTAWRFTAFGGDY